MESNIYKGSSEGVRDSVDGYVDYGQELIKNRVVPDLRDGLKPVQRRILQAMYDIDPSGKVGFKKSARVVGDTMGKYHPHGDSSIYGALCLMADTNGSFNVPLASGFGGLGSVTSTASPSAMRYTESKLNDIGRSFFDEKSIFKMKENENGDGEEAVCLMPKFPSVLVNGATGIAVGAATNIPSFNFNEVIDLTIKSIKRDGNLDAEEDLIYPDFPTGGHLIANKTEIAKMMVAGKGKVKVSADIEVVGNTIKVKEVPYGLTKEKIIKVITENLNDRDKRIQGIKEVRDSEGRDSDSYVEIECKTKNVVDDVILDLYRIQAIQTSLSSDLLVLYEDEPMLLGVFDTIKTWVKWREECLIEKFNLEKEANKEEIERLSYFVRLISNDEWRITYVNKVNAEGVKVGKDYLFEIFEDIPSETADWIADRKLSTFANAERYISRLEGLENYINQVNGYLADIDSYLISELEEQKRLYGSRFERKTKLTTTEYKFTKTSEDVVDDSLCTYIYYKDGFLKKLRGLYSVENSDNIIACLNARNNSTLIGFDIFGRVLSVIGEDIDYCGENDKGIFLPNYFGISAEYIQECPEYKIMYLTVLDGREHMLVYQDGYVGFFDTSVYCGKKRIRIRERGVPECVGYALTEVIEEENKPKYLFVADTHYSTIKTGYCLTDTITKKRNTSRTKVFNGSYIGLDYVGGLNDDVDLLMLANNIGTYDGRVKSSKSIEGTMDFLSEGRYFIEPEE